MATQKQLEARKKFTEMMKAKAAANKKNKATGGKKVGVTPDKKTKVKMPVKK
jgi:hypothetical protein